MNWFVFILGLFLIGLVIWNDFGFLMSSLLGFVGGFLFVISFVLGRHNDN